MKQYWMSLQPRERYTLLTGGIIVVLLLVYLLLIEPFVLELNSMEQRVASQQEELAWMRAAAAEVQKLRAAGAGRQQADSGQSLLSLIDASAKAQGMGNALKQLSPTGDKVRVRLEGTSFDTLLRWFGKLEESGVGVDTLTVERLEAQGMVNATVVLGRGGAG